MKPVQFKRMHPDAIIPARQSDGAAGFDLYSIEDGWVIPHGSAAFDTGIAMAIPEGYDGQVCPRSGLAFKHNIFAVDGEIDPDYRGNVKVLLLSKSDEPFRVTKGDRIAQIVFRKTLTASAEVDELEETTRGTSGFGSTGTN